MSDLRTQLEIEKFNVNQRVATLEGIPTKLFNVSIAALICMYPYFDLPGIQRNHIESAWPLHNKKNYIKNVMEDEDAYGQIVLITNHPDKSSKPHYHNSNIKITHMTIDGHNRLSTIVVYSNNEFPVNGKYYKDLDKITLDKFNSIEVPLKIYLKCMEMVGAIRLFLNYNKGVTIDASTKAKNQEDNSMNGILTENRVMIKCQKLINELLILAGILIKYHWRHSHGRLFKAFYLVYIENCSIDDERIKEILSEKDECALNTNDYIEKCNINGTILEQFILLIEQFILVFNYKTAKDYCSIQCIFLVFLVDKRKEENVSLPADEFARKFGCKIDRVPIRDTSTWYGRHYKTKHIDKDYKHVLDRDTGKPIEKSVEYDVGDIRKEQHTYIVSLLTAVNTDVSKDVYMAFSEKRILPQKKEKRINITAQQRMKFYVKHGVKEDNNGERKGTCIDCGQTNAQIVVGHIFPYAVSNSNAQTNLVPICSDCNQSAATDGNLNQIKHQSKHNPDRTPTILEYMNKKFGRLFDKAHAKLCDNYGDPLSAPYI